MAAVDECFREVELASLVQIFRNRSEYLIENALPLPLLKPSMARRVRRVPTWHVGPRRAGPQHPQDSVKNVARIAPGTSPLSRRALPLRPGNELPDGRPLLVLEVHLEGTNTFLAGWKYPRERWSSLDHLRDRRVMRCALDHFTVRGRSRVSAGTRPTP